LVAQDSSAKLSVVVLTRNEEQNIGAIIEEALTGVSEPFEILVVDDSEDDTPKIVSGYSATAPQVRLAAQEGTGYTNAVRTAVKHAAGEALVVLVGDRSDEIMDIEKMREQLRRGYDIVCASRYTEGGSRSGGNVFQGFFSRLVGRTLMWLVGIPTSDVSNSFKMYRKGIFESMEIEDSSYATSMQITLKAFFNGAKITEVPTNWTGRVAGSSKFLFSKQTKHYVRWFFWAVRKKTQPQGAHLER
jgi:glycosyltransferase involved in cell wall biosynthesis